MGQSSEAAIAEQNRNEATEAIEILTALNSELTEEGKYAAAHKTFKAIELIKKFSEKHQPETQRFK